jgi:hypothetical protein
MRKRSAIVIAVVATGVLAMASTAGAATIEVTDTSDSGAGSLRKAIARANRLPGPDRIVISATGTISLASSLPDLSTDLAIDGPGARRLTIDGHGLTRTIFRIYPRDVTAALSHITVVGGEANGINNSGTLALSHSVVRDALSLGVSNVGDAALTDSVVVDNGRGISNFGGTLTVLQGTVAHNNGVGITQNQAASAAEDALTTVRESTVGGNSTPNSGGGIYVNRGAFTVSRSTLSGNSAFRGGAIAASSGAHLTVLRSTLSGNSASGAQSWGGGIFNDGSSITVAQSTLSGNSAYAGGGIFNLGTPTTLKNTIVADSVGGNCLGVFGGVMVSYGYNLADDVSCGLAAAGDQANTEPLLKPLDFYGGATKTLALRRSSPAVDGGVAGIVPIDQRGLAGNVNYPGVPKAVGGDNSDIGAFELQAP